MNRRRGSTAGQIARSRQAYFEAIVEAFDGFIYLTLGKLNLIGRLSLPKTGDRALALAEMELLPQGLDECMAVIEKQVIQKVLAVSISGIVIDGFNFIVFCPPMANNILTDRK
jgi:hypothetical protein